MFLGRIAALANLCVGIQVEQDPPIGGGGAIQQAHENLVVFGRARPVDQAQRVAGLVKHLSTEIPVLLVEHDIDRVFQIADVVTVMNEGAVLLHGARRGTSLAAVEHHFDSAC